MEYYLLTEALEYCLDHFTSSVANNHLATSFKKPAVMKSSLTENGVMKLYSLNISCKPKLQVLYLVEWQNNWFIRLSDGKILSPILSIQKKKKLFEVGAIISVKQAHWASFTEADELKVPMMDSGIIYLIIKEFKVEVPASDIEKITNISLINNINYWTSLLTVKDCLIKHSPPIKMQFHLECKRRAEMEKYCTLIREKGNEFFKASKYSDAIIHYEIAKRKDPHDYKVWSNSSIAYYKNEEYDNAEEDGLVAIKLNPFSSKTYWRSGQAAYQLEKYETARTIILSGILLCEEHDDLNKLLTNVESAIMALSSKKADVTSNKNNISNKDSENNCNQTKAITQTKGNNNSATTGLGTNTDMLDINKAKIELSLARRDNCASPPSVISRNSFYLSSQVIASPEVHRVAASMAFDYDPSYNSDDDSSSTGIKDDDDDDDIDDDDDEDDDDEDLDYNKCTCAQTKILLNFKEMYEKESPEAISSLDHIRNDCFKNMPQNDGVLLYIRYNLQMFAGKEVVAIVNLRTLLKTDLNFQSPLAVHYSIIKAMVRINNYHDIKDHVKSCFHLLSNDAQIKPLYWPVLKTPIADTTYESIKRYIHSGKWKINEGSISNSLGTCCHSTCLNNDIEYGFRREIYIYDPRFKGYAEISCDQNCLFCYHDICWKELKKQSNGKLTNKDFLKQTCLTPDCSGKINLISIFNDQADLTEEHVGEKKGKSNNVTSTKQKKKKEKKKEKAQAAANRQEEKNDKKRSKTASVSEDVYDPISLEKEEVASQDTKVEEFKPKEYSSEVATPMLDFEMEDISVYKHEFNVVDDISTSKKNKKKKKKKNNNNSNNNTNNSETTSNNTMNNNTNVNKQEVHNTDQSVEPMETDVSNQNDYLSRVKELRSQTESLEAEKNMSQVKGCLPFAARLLNERPLYLPQDLQYSPKYLEHKGFMQSRLQASNFDEESINTLIDFMYDWMKNQGPMHVTDSKLRDYVVDNFFPEAVAYVDMCGGVREFLLQSVKFAQVDNLICTNDQVLAAQEHILKEAAERFKLPKYFISDGHRAPKLSHLFDDMKSNCSTSSVSVATVKSNTEIVANLVGKSSTPIKPKKPIHRLDSFENSPPKLSDLSAPIPMNESTSVEKSKSQQQETSSFNSLDSFRLNKAEDLQLQYSYASGMKFSTPGKEGRTHNFSFTSEYGDGDVFNSDDDVDEVHEIGDENENIIRNLKQEISDLHEQHRNDILTNEGLSNNNQELNNQFYQLKSKSGVEIDILKRKLEELSLQKDTAETNLEWMKNQNDAEKQKLLEEIKNQERKLEQAAATIKELEHANKARDASLMKLTETKSYLEQSLTSSVKRAQEMEYKYLSTKKDLVTSYLKDVGKRLSMETGKLRQLLPYATDDTTPEKSVLIRVIKEWGNNLEHINNTIVNFEEESKKLLNLVDSGRPLGAINDIPVPSINESDFSLIELVVIGQKPNIKSSNPAPPSNSISSSSGNSFGLSSLTSTLSFNLGQLNLGNQNQSDSSMSFMMNGTTPSTSYADLGHQPSSHPTGLGSIGNIGAIGVNVKTTNSTSSSPASSLSTSSSSIASNTGMLDAQSKDDHSKNPLLSTHFYGSRAIGVHHPQDIKSLNKAPGSGQKSSSSLHTLSSLPSTIASSKQDSGSAYGLSDIPLNALEANKGVARTLSTPTTPTATKPKFQNLRTNNDVGAIGTLPPKLIRPQPRQAAANSSSPLVSAGLGSGNPIPHGRDGDDISKATPTAYQKLIEDCKKQFGSEYALSTIHEAIRKVRENNKNSLSGLSVETIIGRVAVQLKGQISNPSKPSIAPWANMTQSNKGIGRKLEGVSEDQCSICLDKLADKQTSCLPCQHVFHADCISSWLKQKSDCPICRSFTLMNDEYPSLSHS